MAGEKRKRFFKKVIDILPPKVLKGLALVGLSIDLKLSGLSEFSYFLFTLPVLKS